MQRKSYSKLNWLDTATRPIRFGPDRRAVWAELNDHLEDKTADLMRIFPSLTREEAQTMALERMGDPEELGAELGRVHKPWLGYLWQASRVLLALMLALLVVTAVRGFVSYDLAGQLADVASWRAQREELAAIDQVLYGRGDPSSLDQDQWTGQKRLALWDLDLTDRLGGAQLHLTKAALWRGEEGDELWFQVEVDCDYPWQKSRIFGSFLKGTDDLGNHYGYQLTLTDTGASQRGFPAMGGSEDWTGHRWNMVIKPLPEQARWVRLTYALRPESGFEWVISLKEVEGR